VRTAATVATGTIWRAARTSFGTSFGTPFGSLFTTRVEMHQNLGLYSPDDHFDVVGNGVTASATFNVPALANDSTLYFAFSYFVDDDRFHTHSTSFAADLPFAPQPPFQRPVKAAPASVVLTFDQAHQH